MRSFIIRNGGFILRLYPGFILVCTCFMRIAVAVVKTCISNGTARERSMFPDSLRLRPARKLNCPLRKQSRESAKRRAASKLIHRLRFVSPRLLAKLGRAPQAFVWEHASLTSRGFASGFCLGSLKGGNGFCRKLRMRRESEVFKDDGLSDG